MPSTQPRNILVVGPSLVTPFWENAAAPGYLPQVSFTVYGSHAAAFLAERPVSANGGALVFNDTFADGHSHTWGSNKPMKREVALDQFDGVMLLDPLFILAGFMRQLLWAGRGGICPYFLEGAERYYPTDAIAGQLLGSALISSSQWLAIYEDWKKGSINTMEAVRSISSDIPIMLLPPASPPQRTHAGLYSYYNLMEQRYIGNRMASRFGAKFILQPRETMDGTLSTFDELHEPDPDPHHPKAAFYRELMKAVDFDAMDFTVEAKQPWL